MKLLFNLKSVWREEEQMKLKEKYITDENGNRIGVLLELEEYHQLLAALEELEAIRAYDRAVTDDDEAIAFETVISEIEQNR
jgi:hypothetical protein